MTSSLLESSAELQQSRSIEYFEQVYQTYQKAELESQNLTVRYFQIANFIVCLRFTGEALINLLTRAIAHLEVSPAETPDLTICLISSQETGISRPAPVWEEYQYQKRGEVRGFVNERIYTARQWESNALVIVDKQQNLALYWVEDHTLIPYWERGAPFQSILNVWLSAQKIQLVHAASIGYPEGCILLVGKGGSGKSTTALSSLNSDLRYVSDDYCLITAEPKPTVFSIYNTGKKNANDLDRLPFLKPYISNPEQLDKEKAVYFIHEWMPEKLLKSAPIHAIFIPRVTGKLNTTMTQATLEESLVALIPSTIMQLGGAGKAACDLITQTLSQLPCFYLNVGTDSQAIHQLIKRFLLERQ